MVSGFQSLYSGATLDDFTAAFVTQDAGKRAFRIFTGQGEGIRVTDSAGNHSE
jgi:hypothetical protein